MSLRPRRVTRRALRGAVRSDRGSTAIQIVVLMPIVFSMMFLGMQGALYYYARSVAIASAQEGARVAGAEGSSADAGVASAYDFVADAGGDDVLRGVRVTGTRSGTTARVVVTGTSMSVFPGWNPSVRQSAEVPVERITG